MRNRFIFLVLIGGCCMSCQQQNKQAATFFDSLTIASTRYLVAHKASLEKHAWSGDLKDSIRIQPDSTYWANDLDVFRQLSAFQKGTLRDAYVMEDGLADGQSNLTIRQFKATGKSPIPFVRFYYYQNIHRLKRIEADYHEDNALFSATRHLTMEFDETDHAAVLTSYSMVGYQKMILSDSSHYAVHAHILY